MNLRNISLSSVAMITLLAAFPSLAQDYRAQAITIMQHDFHAKGIAGTDRLHEDGLQAICNRSNNKPPKEIAGQLEKDQAASNKYPADGKLLGDWKSGEKIAQGGKGMTWSDKAGIADGSCYNCHQIGPKETSFGTIGPSLYKFGKTRGYGPDIQKYAYGKIYNSKSTNLCSSMPRFGHSGALNEQQIKDLVALLMDPNSPVNQ